MDTCITRDGACLLVRDHHGFSFWDTERAEPVTVHFSEPLSNGLGMDAEPYRAIMSPEGTQVHLGHSALEGALWTIAQPRTAVPAWFPDFLECLALMRLDATGTPRLFSGEGIFQIERTPRGPQPR